MTPLRAGLLALCAALAGCGAEGGVTGTGVTSTVSGNVVLVTQPQDAALPFVIRVTVEQAPEATAITDAEGTFTLSGRFSGAITLAFSKAADGAAIGPLTLEIPAGSVTVLENIAIDTAAPRESRVQPAAVRQLDVVGHVDLVECGRDGGTMLVTDNAAPPRQFMVALTPATEILARDGTPLTCAGLSADRRVRVEGLFRLRTQTLVATLVVLGPPPAPPPDMPRRERFRGRLLGVDCAVGDLTVEQGTPPDTVRRLVRLTATSEVRCAGDAPPRCACADLAPGDGLQVVGTIFPRRPGLVVADTVTVVPRAARPAN